MSKWLLTAPGIFVNAFLIVGVSVATFGPLQYQDYLAGTVTLFIFFVLIFFNIGYLLGTRTRCPTKAIFRRSQNKVILVKLFRVCLTLAILLVSYEFFLMALSGGFTLNLANSAQNYINSYANYTRNSGSYDLRFLISSLGTFPLFVAQVFGIFYFKSLNKKTKLAVIFLLVATVLVFTLGSGKQKQLGDIIVYIGSLVVAQRAASGNFNLSSLMKVSVALLLGLIFLLALLSFRYQAIDIDLYNLNDNIHPLVELSNEDWLVSILGEQAAFPLIMFSGYLGQGYYGLSLSLEQPFVWTQFAGSSYSVSVIMNQFFGTEFLVLDSYPYRVGVTTGWDQTKWHTAFSWLASDFSFPGVVILMAFLGFIYGRAWREILLYKNPFSILIFATMNIGLIYAPANNQLMHSPGGLFSTITVFLMYFLFHTNFNAAPTELGRARKV